jgi:hypothetical protein
MSLKFSEMLECLDYSPYKLNSFEILSGWFFWGWRLIMELLMSVLALFVLTNYYKEILFCCNADIKLIIWSSLQLSYSSSEFIFR